MYKVKIFYSPTSENLENKINEFFGLNTQIKIIDIKYSRDFFGAGVVIIYKE